MVMAFTTNSLLVYFYIMEGSLIPLVILLKLFGHPGAGQNRAIMYIWLYTLVTGTSFLLVALVYKQFYGTYNVQFIIRSRLVLEGYYPVLIYLGFAIPFITKLPLMPFHRWLPNAHVEAPLSGSILLAGILLKVGGYGFIKFANELCPIGQKFWAPYFQFLCLFTFVSAGIAAIGEGNIKRIVALSSVAHMGVASYGLFAVKFNNPGMIEVGELAAIISYWAHGFISPALFISVTIIKKKVGTFEITALGGAKQTAPMLTVITFISLLLGMGIPTGLGFYGELLTVYVIWPFSGFHVLWVAIGIWVGIVYSCRLFYSIFYGPQHRFLAGKNLEVSRLQLHCFILLLTPVILGGLYPGFFMG